MPDPHDRPPTNSDRTDEEDSSSHSAMPGLDSDQLFNAVCRSLSFRNLSRRKSLRKVHRRTVDIAQKLNLIADSAYECQDWSMAGAVVRFWVTICADAALGRALLQQGILYRTLRLVDSNVCSTLLTQLLSLLAHHGDRTVKVEILRSISTMFSIPLQMQTWRLDSHQTSSSIIMALYHCLDAVALPNSPTATATVTQGMLFGTDLSATVLATHIVEHLPKPHVPHSAIVHSIALLIVCALSCAPTGIEPVIPALEVLTMLVIGRNIGLRCVALWTFGRLCPDTSDQSSTALRLSPHIADEGAPPGGEIAEAKRCTREMLTLVQNLATDGDLWQFGVKMADVVMRGRPMYADADLLELRRNQTLSGFDTWDKLLRETVLVVMQKDCRYRDKADVLFVERQTLFEPRSVIEECTHQVLHWNGTHAYAHVVLAENASHLEWALQTAIDGLALGDLTPYLKRRLLLRALDLSYQKGCAFLLGANGTEIQRQRNGKGWLRLGLDYAHRFIKDAPKDSRDLPHVADLCMAITLILRGPSLGDDLAPIQPIQRVLDRSLSTLHDLGIDVGDNSIRAGNRLFVQYYPQGLEKWGVLFSGFHIQDHMFCTSTTYPRKLTHLPEHLQRHERPGEGNSTEVGDHAHSAASGGWWDEMTLHNLLQGALRCCCRASEQNGYVQLGPGLVTLLQCTWCGDTTALIKQCGGCEHAWYCNSTCQRAHWPEHRKECRIAEHAR